MDRASHNSSLRHYSLMDSLLHVLNTVDCEESLASTFDLVMRLSSGAPRDTRTVYTQYGVLYLLDLLYNRYYLLYGEG